MARTTANHKPIIQRASIILGAVVIGFSLTLIALASYLVFFDYRADADERSRAGMLTVFEAMDSARPENREQLAGILTDNLLAVEYVQVPSPVPDANRPELARAIIGLLTIRLDDTTMTQFALSDGHTIRIGSQTLSGGERPSLWITMSLLTLLLLVAVSLWALTRYLSPIQKVVDAADQLSLERELTPISEADGPALARDAAKAFNRMQSRIKEYLRERSLMIHALHHDLRHGMFKLQMRMEQVDDPVLQDKSVRDISDLLEVLEEILAFADTDVGPDQRQNIRVNSLVYGAIDTYVDQGRTIDVTLTGPHTVFANQTRLKRVIGNLVGNAMAYADCLWISSRPTDTHYHLIFDDDGPGIPVEERERMLLPFQRMDGSRNRASGGTGLGLAIVKRSIDRDQGQLELLDSDNGGLRVVVSLPRPPKS